MLILIITNEQSFCYAGILDAKQDGTEIYNKEQ
jgi:hypothetical protein